MEYSPSERILERYADVLVNFALGSGKGIKKGEVVRVTAPRAPNPSMQLCKAISRRADTCLVTIIPDDVSGAGDINMSRRFLRARKARQSISSPEANCKILADTDRSYDTPFLPMPICKSLKGIDPKKIHARRGRHEAAARLAKRKGHQGQIHVDIALYGTPAMAHEAGL